MKKIEDFLNQFDSPNTQKVYASLLRTYFNYLKINPDHYTTPGRDYEADIQGFWKMLKTNNYARKTRSISLTCVREYLIYNDIELSQKFWKSLRKSAADRGQRSATIDQAPTPVILRKLLDHADTITRAAVLTLSSSGMRIGELVQLLPSDLHLDNDPPYIDIRADITKTKTSRYVFISYEARDSIKAWQRERTEWIRIASWRLRNIKGAVKPYDDGRVFPISSNCLRSKYNLLLKKAEVDQRDNNTKIHYRVYHIHTLRKYFTSYLSVSIKDGSAIVHGLLGHDEYLDTCYKRYNLEQLGTMYKEAMTSIQVYDRNSDLSGVHEELNELKKDKASMRQEIHELRNLISELGNKRLQENKEKEKKSS